MYCHPLCVRPRASELPDRPGVFIFIAVEVSFATCSPHQATGETSPVCGLLLVKEAARTYVVLTCACALALENYDKSTSSP